MRRSARLRSVMLRADEDVALELRIVARDLRAGERHRDGLPGARAHHGLARLVRGLQQVEVLALALVERRGDAAAEDLLFGVAEHLAGRGVRDLDDAVRRGDEHRIGHAVEHAVQVVLVDGRLAQLGAHALERLLQLAELVAAHHIQRAGVVALPDALRAADQRDDGLLELAAGAPAEGGADEAAERRECRRPTAAPCCRSARPAVSHRLASGSRLRSRALPARAPRGPRPVSRRCDAVRRRGGGANRSAAPATGESPPRLCTRSVPLIEHFARRRCAPRWLRR